MIVFLVYAALMIGFTVLTTLSIFYLSKFRNLLLIISYLLIGIGSVGGIYLLMGKPLPMNVVSRAMYLHIEQAEVIAFKLVENYAIYLLVVVPGQPDPILISLPWNKKTGQRIQDLGKRVFGEGNQATDGQQDGIIVDRPFNPSLEERPNDFNHGIPPQRTNPRKRN